MKNTHFLFTVFFVLVPGVFLGLAENGGGDDKSKGRDPAESLADTEEPAAEHVEQSELYDLVVSGRDHDAFELAFEVGDELFEVEFNALDGGGAHVGQSQRFTRVPRADLTGPSEWAHHFPKRETGPNAQSCVACHQLPFDDGAGTAAANVHRDPTHSGTLSQFIIRNTTHLFAPGAIQRLAEEMTEALHRDRERAKRTACAVGQAASSELHTKGISFGVITATPISTAPCEAEFDLSRVQGVGDDLVVRPFQWKGNTATVREFNRGAAHNELGMQAVEIVGDGVDGDGDAVTDELGVGDLTALTIYLAAQPRPTSKLELDYLGLIPRLSAKERSAIFRGRRRFAETGCDSCHRSTLRINDPVFREPSQSPNFRDVSFPAGQDPVDRLLDPSFPVTFDLTRDQPDNVITFRSGRVYRLGSLRRDRRGGALVTLYGDLKRHEMGAELAETIDETGTGRSTWLTKELWGVGSTGPWLHDGRATTLGEAILAHGGEAEDERVAFEALAPRSKADLVAFLDNLVLFKIEEEEEE